MAKETLSQAALNTILQGVNAPTASAVNFDTGAGTSTYALAVYDKEGNLLGYVPVFDTAAFDAA